MAPISADPVAINALLAEDANLNAPSPTETNASADAMAPVEAGQTGEGPKEGHSRRRGRGRGRSRERRPEEATRTLAPDAAAPERSERPGRPEPRHEPRHEPRSDAAKGKRRDGDDSEAREPKFKGMGDHVPAFLLRSVERKQDA